MRLEAKVLTVSTSAHLGTRADRSGPALVEALTARGFTVVATAVVADGDDAVAEMLTALSDGFAGLLLTTGGTGFAPSDRTPEGTLKVLERLAPGLAEAIRAASPLGRLSRGVAGTVGRCIVANLPGSTTGALESLDAIADVLPHALHLLDGGEPH